MVARPTRLLTSYNCLAERVGNVAMAFQVVERMEKEGVLPDAVTLKMIARGLACARKGVLDWGFS